MTTTAPQTTQTPTQTPQKTPPKLVLKPVLAWHAEKGTKRDLLAIGATLLCLDPEQPENTLAEAEMTEADFDRMILEARAIHAQALKDAGKPSALKLLVHSKLLLAVLVRRPKQAEADNLVKAIADPDLGEEETLAQMRFCLTSNLLWPKEASDQMAHIMEVTPIAFGHIFPKMLVATLGSDMHAQKKLG